MPRRYALDEEERETDLLSERANHPLWFYPLHNCRAIPIDMAGFAVNLKLVLEKPRVVFGRNVHGGVSRYGYLESDFLEHFTTRAKVECMGSETEV